MKLASWLKFWPNCVTPDCANKSCIARNSIYCFPCTDRLKADNSAPANYFDALRAEREKEKKS